MTATAAPSSLREAKFVDEGSPDPIESRFTSSLHRYAFSYECSSLSMEREPFQGQMCSRRFATPQRTANRNRAKALYCYIKNAITAGEWSAMLLKFGDPAQRSQVFIRPELLRLAAVKLVRGH